MKIKQNQPMAKELIDSILMSVLADKSNYQTPISNAKAVRAFLNKRELSSRNCYLVEYKKGDEIVNSGLVADKELQKNERFAYAHVPLGLILEGEVVVIKGGKATKHLGVGDFIGLFETSDWISNKKTRHIGDWTLVANAHTKIVFFGKSALEADDEFTHYLVELARKDPVPQPITSLPLLDWVASHTTKSRLSDCVVIAHTHLLPNNFPLFRHLAHLVDFGHTYVVEKPYSTVPSVVKELVRSGVEIMPVKIEKGVPYEFAVQKSLEVLWRRIIAERKSDGFNKILIIDDGADVWFSIPWQQLGGVRIAGVEQTQRGITRIQNSNLHMPPIVSVATSGIKKLIEPNFIGYSIVKKLKELGRLKKVATVGILGMGAIGQAVLHSLQALGKDAIFYDSTYHKTPPDAKNARNAIDTLLNESDLIIGATGTDVLRGVTLDRVTGHKILVSASSADIEFTSLLKLGIWPDASFSPVVIPIHKKLTVEILNGGYPINFDRKKDATPDEDIVLTRCLLYIGAMQAVELFKEPHTSGIYNVDLLSQKMLLSRWIKEKTEAGSHSRITELSLEEIIDFKPLTEGKDMLSIWQD